MQSNFIIASKFPYDNEPLGAAFCVISEIEDLGNLLEVRADAELLRTDLFAFRAAYTVGCLASAFGEGGVRLLRVARIRVDIVETGEQIGNGDLLRTALLAVTAGGAGDHIF